MRWGVSSTTAYARWANTSKMWANISPNQLALTIGRSDHSKNVCCGRTEISGTGCGRFETNIGVGYVGGASGWH